MSVDELDREIASGVTFWGYGEDGTLQGVMGLQPLRDVDLIRHAYVLPGNQRRGVGGNLLQRLRQASTKPMLVGTWAAPSGQFASMSAMASRWSRRRARRCF